MIIQCEKCRTRFKLDDSRVTESGVRVRCSRCGHTFAVKKEAPGEETDFDALLEGFGGTEGKQSRDGSNASVEGGTSGEASHSSSEGAPHGEKGAAVTPPAEEKPGSPEQEPSADVPQHSREEVSDLFPEGFGLTHFQVAHAPVGAEQPVAVGDADSGVDIASRAGGVPVGEPVENGAISTGVPTGHEMGTLAPDAPPAGDTPPVAAQEVRKWPVADSRDEETAGTEMPPLSISSRRKKSPLFSILVGVLCLVAVIAAGVFLFRNGTGERSGRSPKGGAGDGGRAVIRSLEGSFLVNREAGELLVIRGEVFNSSGKPLTSLRVQGTVYRGDGSVIARRTVFFGNTFTPEELAFRSYSGMEKTMNRQFGDTLANLEIPPGKGIPFAIVFRNVPKEGKDFGVEIVDSAGAPLTGR
ncbi:MAG: DUF3426 domain-containing protein [Geobacteraceae bacterium]|nr:DUF3426 domain-containing protein [Geobacteraceae bacterium]